MRLKDLLEAFNTKASYIEYKKLSQFRSELRFEERGQLYGVRFDQITPHQFEFPKDLKILEDKFIINIMFGDIDKNNEMNFKADNRTKNTSSIRVISKIVNIILDAVNLSNPSLIIFSAKKMDEIYKSRVALYEHIISNTQKATDYSSISFEDGKGTYFVLFDRKLNLSKQQITELENQMKDSLWKQILDKLKGH